jgi:hypothetical protein
MKAGTGANLRTAFFLFSVLLAVLMMWRVHQANRISKLPASYPPQFLGFAGTGQIKDARIYPGYDSTGNFGFFAKSAAAGSLRGSYDGSSQTGETDDG